MAKHLQSLHLKAITDQHFETDGPTCQVASKNEAPKTFQNPNRWHEFHNDHGHKTEDHISLTIEVNELLKKGYIQKFVFDKAKNFFNNKEENIQLAIITLASPPPYDRVINVISGGAKVIDITHASAKKSSRNAKNDQETKNPKRLMKLPWKILSQTATCLQRSHNLLTL
ncbi:hypothetical protein DY000_02039815 [Brassica cretica]|uniref:Uncharacterized protein n=1 Tax=Brassica cretica TaxID=69181 RepID=A0ABQ7BG08_BRACR|nr:hypothetical protein DY000_02039815 [Brassica cretica]